MQEGVIGDEPGALRGIGDEYVDTGEYLYPNCAVGSDTCLFDPFTGHRGVDMARSITVSSDTYYYQIAGEDFGFEGIGEDGLRLDEGIQKWARLAGLGVDSGLQIPYERSGVVPDRSTTTRCSVLLVRWRHDQPLDRAGRAARHRSSWRTPTPRSEMAARCINRMWRHRSPTRW